MTVYQTLGQEKRNTRVRSYGNLFLGFSVLFLFLLMLKNAEIANRYMLSGLQLCARAIIPSLFPFLMLSELLMSSPISRNIIGRLSRPLGCLIGLNQAGRCAVLLGMLCGFPIGAKCICAAYDQGMLTRKETEHALCFSNNPSPAFLVGVVGVSLWNNRRFGWALYLIAVAVNLLCAVLLFHNRKKHTALGCAPICTPIAQSEKKTSAVTRLTRSMGSATSNMLLICGYVVFFTVLGGTIGEIANTLFHVPKEWSALMQCILELSGGVSQCNGLDNKILALILTAFAVGWSGFSVHCQVLSICEGRGFSFRTYFLCKIIQGLICALLLGVILLFFPLL